MGCALQAAGGGGSGGIDGGGGGAEGGQIAGSELPQKLLEDRTTHTRISPVCSSWVYQRSQFSCCGMFSHESPSRTNCRPVYTHCAGSGGFGGGGSGGGGEGGNGGGGGGDGGGQVNRSEERHVGLAGSVTQTRVPSSSVCVNQSSQLSEAASW